MEPDHKTLADYIDLLRRHKAYIVIPWLLITLASIVAAYYIPKTFKSSALLMMETPMPTKLTDSSDSLFANDQIQTIYQRVLTTNTVMNIIQKLDLFDNIKEKNNNKYDLVESFKGGTEVELALTSLADRNAKMSNIVFKLSFSYFEPSKAQAAVNELAAVMIAQNDQSRTQSADKLTQFLTDELEKLNLKSQDIDRKIVEYKEKNSHTLPERTEMNQAAFDRYEVALKDNESQIRTAKQKIEFLQLSMTRMRSVLPDTPIANVPKTRGEQLKSLRAQYLQLSGVYSPSHPTLTRLKREIAGLGAFEEDASGFSDELTNQLKKAKQNLALLEKTYAQNYPDIQKTKKQISQLEQQISKIGEGGDVGQPVVTDPVDLELQMQYKNSQSELELLLEKQAYLQKKFEQAQANLLVSPQVEVVYSDLLRERESTLKKYNQLKEKWLDAKLVQSMEQQQQGHTLSIIEPAFLPTHPENAIRRKVAVGGFLGGLAFGIALAFAIEFFDPGIKGYRALVAATGFMPLVIIPYIDSPAEENKKLANKRQSQRALMWTITLALVAATVLLGLYLWRFYNPELASGH
jgi:polysaccharide biosynthesis transport protein